MSSTREQLLQGVLDRPDDEATRLVCADWLQDNGEETWAEFIRVQCALASMTGTEGPRLTELAQREKELWTAQGATWCASLPKWARPKVYFRRGFPAILSSTQTQWIGARSLLQHAPIQALEVQRFDPKKLVGFAATPHLAGVRRVRVLAYPHRDRVEIIRELSRSACAPGLCLLDLHRGGCAVGSTAGDDLAVALAGSTLTGLECLSLSYSEIGPDGLAQLAASPVVSRLRKLDLNNNQVGDAGVQALAGSARLANLTALSLVHCEVTDAGVAALAQSPHLSNLTHLNLWGYEFTAASAEAIASSPYLRKLTALTFHFGGLGPAGARALAGAANLSRLTYLNLFGSVIGDEGFQALVESPYLMGLRTLEVGSNELTEAGLRRLDQAPGRPALERLGLCATPGVEAMVKKLKKSAHLPNLRDVAIYPGWTENATAQEITEQFAPLLGETMAKRL
jgi:uncharacterized protein (TIGR02996 family)